jgi:septal ring factor EnvC (AmiA/AmiB activator)
MAGKKENTKKVAGNARKAEAAAQKSAAADKAAEAAEAENWSKGSKSNAKKYVITEHKMSLLSQWMLGVSPSPLFLILSSS